MEFQFPFAPTHLILTNVTRFKRKSLPKILFLNILFVIFLTFFNRIYCDNPLYTNEFAVKLVDGHDVEVANQIASKHGFVNKGKIGQLEDHYLFVHHRISKRSVDHHHEIHSKLRQESEIQWVEQQRVLKRTKREIRHPYLTKPTDPLFREQWYLNKGARNGFDMNVVGAWKLGYTGKGVVITILDDGIQTDHPDLLLNYDAQASFDINDNDPDPTPQDNGDNKHGTRCAGEVAAEAFNEFCGVGIAFNSSIGGVRMLDGTVTDEVEARALSLNPDHIDIYSASWGPEDDGKTVDGPGRLALRAFIDGIKKGRNGLGSVFVWASGNGGRRLDNCNCDGYTNSIYTLSISSATQNGIKPWYLEECSSTLATTYSSGTPGRDGNVVTADQDTSYFRSLREGREPATARLCTRSHTGTSASAPIAAAIVALGLEANPNLSWRDLQHLVILSSRYEPLKYETGWITNAVGRKISHKFGYGLIDAEALVRMAEKWAPLPLQRICEGPVDDTEREISTLVKKPLEVSMTVDACHGTSNFVQFLEHVQVRITLKYRPRGNLKITIVSPSGTYSHILLPRPRDTEDSAFTNWPFLTVHFWGERSIGTWKLMIQNEGPRQSRWPGKLISWSLIFFGTESRPLSYNWSASSEISRYLPRRTFVAKPLNECAKKGQFQLLDKDECVTFCPFGQWGNYETGKCQMCNSKCLSCFGPTLDNCLSCGVNTYFYGYHCVKDCPDTHYDDENLHECLPCSYTCERCEGSRSKCTSCKKPLILKENKCVAQCQIIGNSSECITCHESCNTCNGPKENQCTSCRPGSRLTAGKCSEKSCLQNYFETKTPLGLECRRCHATCRTCNGPSHKNCLTCYYNSTLMEDGICYTCLERQYMNEKTQTCSACYPSCLSCDGPTLTDCTGCEFPNFLDYYSQSGTRCVPCCTSDANNVLQNNQIDCCRCLSSNGPCASAATGRTRSVWPLHETLTPKNHLTIKSNEDFLHSLFTHPIGFIVTICFSTALVFVIVFGVLQLLSRKNWLRGENAHKYKKISSEVSARYDKNMEKIALTSDDQDEEDCLFEKT